MQEILRMQNPLMPSLARKEASTSLWQAMGMGLLQKALSHWQGDQLQLTLPDQSVHLLGDALAFRTWEIRVHKKSFFKHLILGSDLGFAESYLQGEWSTPDLARLLEAFARQQSTEAESLWSLPWRIVQNWRHRLRSNTRKGSKRNIAAHYDLGNDFYFQWLDTHHQYSSAIFPHEHASLEAAQDHKLNTLIQRLDPKPGMSILEIGSGWGELAIRLARDYACKVTTLTLSEQQYAYVNHRIAKENLSPSLEIRLQDYRDVQGTFDAVVSIEMIEAVGHENLPTYFAQIQRLLKPQGRAVLQAITMPEHRYKRYLRETDFIQTYIFPGGHCPSVQAMVDAMSKSTTLKVLQVQDYALDYAKTLQEWRKRFFATWSTIAPLGFDERFQRMWEYYLCYCEAGFRASRIGLVQLALQKVS